MTDMRPFDRDPFEDFDKQFNRASRFAIVFGILWGLFWMAVAVSLVLLLWKHFG